MAAGAKKIEVAGKNMEKEKIASKMEKKCLKIKPFWVIK